MFTIRWDRVHSRIERDCGRYNCFLDTVCSSIASIATSYWRTQCLWYACLASVPLACRNCTSILLRLHGRLAASIVSDRFSHLANGNSPKRKEYRAQECLSLELFTPKGRELSFVRVRNDRMRICIRFCEIRPCLARKGKDVCTTKRAHNVNWKYRFHIHRSLITVASSESEILSSKMKKLCYNRAMREIIKIETWRFDVPKSDSIRSPPLFGQWACLACSEVCS